MRNECGTTAREELILLADDHPEAKGRTAQAGEVAWMFSIPLEDGRLLRLKMGKLGRESLLEMLGSELIDDVAEEAGR